MDQFGNTALKPGALFPWAPNDVLPQRAKYWASEVGLRYSLQQTVTYVNMTDVMQGDNNLAYYTLAFAAKWAVYNDPPSGTAGWVGTQINSMVMPLPAYNFGVNLQWQFDHQMVRHGVCLGGHRLRGRRTVDKFQF